MQLTPCILSGSKASRFAFITEGRILPFLLAASYIVPIAESVCQHAVFTIQLILIYGTVRCDFQHWVHYGACSSVPGARCTVHWWGLFIRREDALDVCRHARSRRTTETIGGPCIPASTDAAQTAATCQQQQQQQQRTMSLPMMSFVVYGIVSQSIRGPSSRSFCPSASQSFPAINVCLRQVDTSRC